MLGLAVGDALGAPVAGLRGGHILQLYGEITGYVDPEVAWKQKPHRWRRPGLYSGDAQQALALADTLVKCRGFDLAYFAGRLTELARAETGEALGGHRGLGTNFRAVLQALEQGVPLTEAGQPSAGLGAMARSAPCGLYFAGNSEALMRAAVEQGLLTHRDPRSLVMAALVAQAVSLSVTGVWDRTKPRERLQEIASVAEEAERLVEKEYIHRIPVSCMDRFGLAASALRLLPRLPDLPRPEMAFAQIVAEANRQFPEHKITEPGQGFVMAAGISALYIALTASDYEDAVKTAIRLGKDTDAMAAIAGAILAARFGEDAIPAPWKRGLVNAGQVALRGDALFHRSSEGLGLKDFVSMETELTRGEAQARAELIAKLTRRGEFTPPAPRSVQPPKPSPAAPSSPLDRQKKKQKPPRVKAPWKK